MIFYPVVLTVRDDDESSTINMSSHDFRVPSCPVKMGPSSIGGAAATAACIAGIRVAATRVVATAATVTSVNGQCHSAHDSAVSVAVALTRLILPPLGTRPPQPYTRSLDVTTLPRPSTVVHTREYIYK